MGVDEGIVRLVDRRILRRGAIERGRVPADAEVPDLFIIGQIAVDRLPLTKRVLFRDVHDVGRAVGRQWPVWNELDGRWGWRRWRRRNHDRFRRGLHTGCKERDAKRDGGKATRTARFVPMGCAVELSALFAWPLHGHLLLRLSQYLAQPSVLASALLWHEAIRVEIVTGKANARRAGNAPGIA